MSSDIETGERPEEAQDGAEKPKLSLDVKVDKPSACLRHITVSIPRQDIERYLKEAYDELKPKAEVPGFRPGRAPRKLVETRFREQVAEQVKGQLLMDSMTQVSEDHDFSAISEPDFDIDSIEMPDEGPMTFEFNVEVRPEFDMPEWKGLKLEKPVHEYSDADVEQETKRLLSRYGRMTVQDGPAQADDFVVLNITFRHGDGVLSRVERESVRVRPVLSFRDAKFEGFGELITGAKAGDQREATIKLSEDVEDEALRGQEVKAEFEVVEVKRLELPKVNEAFLEKIGGFESEDDLRDAVRGSLERQLTYHQQQRIRQQITNQLTKDADWELPQDLLRRQSHRELARAVMELQSSGFSQDVIRAHQNELRQNSLQSTARALKEHFILERIAEEHDIDAQPEDYDREVMMIAMQSNESPRRVRARLEKRGQMDALRNQIIERQVIQLITTHAEFKEVPLNLKPDDTEALDLAVSGQRGEGDIPEAKHADEAEELREPADRS